MGKEVKEAGLVVGSGGTRKGLKFMHKIDLHASFMLLLHLYLAPVMFASVRTNFVYVAIPHDLFAYGPITFNVTDPGKRVKELLCNPNYKTFVDEFMTEDMISFKEARSAAFDALPEVQQQISAIDSAEQRTFSEFGISVNGLCHLLPPAYDWGGCIDYNDMLKDCLDGECGTNPNRCFWRNIKTVALAAYGQLICYVPAVLMTMGMIYDPPPAGCKLLLRPLYCGIFYLLTAIFSFLGLLVVTVDVTKYSPASMTEAYPDFSVNFDAGWDCFCFGGLTSLLFGIIFMYLYIFSPKYPREKSRWDVRHQNFEKSLVRIKERAQAAE